ncbi:MAG: signal peptidase II [Geobacteraceae bacterium]|nr:signal peptidase II [Geobacteraceae bacterium]
MMSIYVIFTGISMLVLAIDQGTKSYIIRSMELYSSIAVVENFFNITYLRNRGAAFGIFADSAFRLPFFILVAFVALLFILFMVRKLSDQQKLSAVALSLIFSGALCNLIDRVRLGEVTDFLDVYWRGHHWPAFNVADSAIFVGVVLIALENIINPRSSVSHHARNIGI